MIGAHSLQPGLGGVWGKGTAFCFLFEHVYNSLGNDRMVQVLRGVTSVCACPTPLSKHFEEPTLALVSPSGPCAHMSKSRMHLDMSMPAYLRARPAADLALDTLQLQAGCLPFDLAASTSPGEVMQFV